MKSSKVPHSTKAITWVVGMLLTMAISGCGKRDSSGAAASTPSALPSAPRVALEQGTTRQQIESGPLEPACSVENIVDMSNERPFPIANATYSVPRDKVVKLIGFGTVKSKGEPLGAFTAYLAGTAAVYKIAGKTDLERPDVVSFFKAPGTLKSGFQIDADLREVPTGDYMIYLQVAGGATCPTHHTLRIQ